MTVPAETVPSMPTSREVYAAVGNLLRATLREPDPVRARVFLDDFLTQLAHLGVTPTPSLPAAARAAAPAARFALSIREMQILRGIGDARSNAEIAARLHVSEDTVKSHASKLFRKLGARDRTHAVAIAFREGLLT